MMDTETALRQRHKDNMHNAYRQLESAYRGFAKDAVEKILPVDPMIWHIWGGCLSRLQFAFYTMLDIIVDGYDATTARYDLEAFENSPDGLRDAIQTFYEFHSDLSKSLRD